MKNEHLITPQEFAVLARPVSIHLDDDEVVKFIDECEDVFIIPAIGYGNFKAIVSTGNFDDVDEDFDPVVFAEGGEYEDTEECGCSDGKKVLKYCKGLKATLAYYVYAKMLRSDGSIVSRAGYMRHNDEYASHVDDNQKQYSDVMNIADKYMGDCLQYLKKHTVDKTITPVRNSRARIIAMGD